MITSRSHWPRHLARPLGAYPRSRSDLREQIPRWPCTGKGAEPSRPLAENGIDTIWCRYHVPCVATVVQGDFEWDDAKAAANLVKHGVTFEEAATAITDPDAVFLADDLRAERFAAIGASARGRTLYVVHVERGQRERIISARTATAAEQTLYTQR